MRGAEEFPHRGHNGLGVDQIVRHRAGHVGVDSHAFLHGPFHADQPDPELVFQQFADRAHTTIAEVVNVIDLSDVPAQLEEVPDCRVEVSGIQHPAVQWRSIRFAMELDIELHPADPREVVLAAIEEHATEQVPGSLARRRIAGAQLAIDLEEGILLRLDAVFAQRLRQHGTALVILREDHSEFPDAVGRDRRQGLLGHRGVRLAAPEHFPAFRVEQVVGEDRSHLLRRRDQVLGRARQPIDACFPDLLQQTRGDLAPLAREHSPFGLDRRSKLCAEHVLGDTAL